MEYVSPSFASRWPFDTVIARLKQHERVAGLLLTGSFARNEQTPASDYDLVILLNDAPKTWFVGVTTIDGRFADLIFVDAQALRAIQALDPDAPADPEFKPILRWLKDGVILFDRTGRLARAQQNVRQSEWGFAVQNDESYRAWFALNYNLAVAKRMLAAPDQLYQAAARIRMAVYGHADLWWGYFTIRKLAWDGDKAAVGYLQQNDPVFLDRYLDFITAAAPDEKLLRYEQAAAIAAAPLGGIWPANITAFNDAQAYQTWQALIGEDG
jgi:predicted nucleotidyltransferase